MEEAMAPKLETYYLGLPLTNPLVAAASPLTAKLSSLMLLEQAGAAAAVMMSLFQEQIESDAEEFQRIRRLADLEPSASRGFVPGLDDYNCGPNSYLRHLEAAKRAVSIPIISSLNVSCAGPWVRFARLLEQSGADALELNIYFVPTDPSESGAEIENRYVDIVAAVRAETSLPLAVKLLDCFSSLPHVAQRLIAAGASGLVLFNRPLQPDIDLQTFEMKSTLTLSSAEELRARLRWLAILSRQVSISLAATGGAESAEDAVKLLLAGADVVMLASALIRHGPQHLAVMLERLSQWLQERNFTSIDQLRGAVNSYHLQDAAVSERTHYMRAITTTIDFLHERRC
jgi:dihydroorotate dehydrogenase (fumarate)